MTAAVRRRRRLGRGWLLPIWGWLVILWLSSPIIVMIIFGFNDGNGRQVSTTWNGFTLKWYQNLFIYSDLTSAIKTSISIALATTAICVVLGTLMGVAMGIGGITEDQQTYYGFDEADFADPSPKGRVMMLLSYP